MPTARKAVRAAVPEPEVIARPRPLPPWAVHPKNRDVWVNNASGPGGLWQVIYRTEVVSLFTRQIDAVRYGRGLALEKKTELVICRPNGRIRRKISYGADSRRRKG